MALRGRNAPLSPEMKDKIRRGGIPLASVAAGGSLLDRIGSDEEERY